MMLEPRNFSSLSVTCTIIHIPLKMYWPRLFCLHMMMFFFSLPSFLLIGTAVSEISELNQNKKEGEEKGKNNPSHAYILYNFTIFNQGYILTISKTSRSLVHYKLKVIIGIP